MACTKTQFHGYAEPGEEPPKQCDEIAGCGEWDDTVRVRINLPDHPQLCENCFENYLAEGREEET